MIEPVKELELETFPHLCGQWLQGNGPDGDVVISSRIRLARNVANYPFPMKMGDQQRHEVVEMIGEAISGQALRVDLDTALPIDRTMLVERHLISKELANGEGARSVIFGRGEIVSIMVNEEDHLRIQCIKSGFSLDRIWKALSRIDRFLEAELPFSFHDLYGYLTACPTNVGTGMRVSVMLHLPALTMKQHLGKVHKALEHMNLMLRGLYGEGTQAVGDFYQVSNQVTLGHSEEDLIEQISELIPVVLRYERGMRETLLNNDRKVLEDGIGRALATLRGARRINVREMMEHMSQVRLGISLGMIADDSLNIVHLNELFVICQPAHLQKRERRSLTPDERDELRANIIRSKFSTVSLN